MICTVAECRREAVGRGYCENHYRSIRRHGDPLKRVKNPPGAFQHCTAEGCAGRVLARGLCNKHYSRMRAHGDANATVTPKAGDGEPLCWLLKAIDTETDECLEWPFSKANGYGKLWIGGELWIAPRYVCIVVHGEPGSPELQAAHDCGNRPCVNKRHVKWKTPAENEADKFVHGTRGLGDKSPGHKLTESQAREILHALGAHVAIARTFGVSRRTVGAIKSRLIWRHL